MSDISNEALAGILLLLIVLSGFFSSSETGLMAINRVRLQHQAEEGSKAAARILSLLDRPDRLIGLILIGNNFVNILEQVLALRLLGPITSFTLNVIGTQPKRHKLQIVYIE